MSEIKKTEAVVLSKLNYGDSSLIVTLFTKEQGKISAIVKGARSPKSKTSLKIDPLNYIEIIYYNKESRELQIISSADLVEYYPAIKSDLDKLKYAQSVLELVKNLTVEHEQHVRLFNGIIRIFELLETSNKGLKVIFARFFMFFLEEIGYRVHLADCSVCGKKDLLNKELSYNFTAGLLCEDCKTNYTESFPLNQELFNCLVSLRNSKNLDDIGGRTVDNALIFMEKYLKYHVADFKGIQSLQLFK
jgi:DNA repair protein RecO (recombination protein O)